MDICVSKQWITQFKSTVEWRYDRIRIFKACDRALITEKEKKTKQILKMVVDLVGRVFSIMKREAKILYPVPHVLTDEIRVKYSFVISYYLISHSRHRRSNSKRSTSTSFRLSLGITYDNLYMSHAIQSCHHSRFWPKYTFCPSDLIMFYCRTMSWRESVLFIF